LNEISLPDPNTSNMTYAGQAATQGAWGGLLIHAAWHLPSQNSWTKKALYLAGAYSLAQSALAVAKLYQRGYAAQNEAQTPSSPGPTDKKNEQSK
jgi:hypothetical protein